MSHVDPRSPAAYPVSPERRASGIVDARPCELGWTDPAMPPAMVLTYDVDLFESAAFIRHGIVMPASIERSVRKRQAEFLMGRLAARDALAALGVPDEPIAIGSSRQPLWPARTLGSITHAGRYAAAVAMAADGITGLGIDIERRIAAETRGSIEDTVLDADEQSLLHALSGDTPYELLLTIAFSAKESFFKGCFTTVGSYFDFDAVDLTMLDVTEGTLELVIAQPLAPTLPRGRRFTLRTRFLDADTVLTSFVW